MNSSGVQMWRAMMALKVGDYRSNFWCLNLKNIKKLTSLFSLFAGKPFFSGLDEHITDDAGGFGTGKDYPNGFHSTVS